MSLSDTEKIKEKVDIIDLIGEYVQIKAAGTYHKGLCPFHNEKTPSFTVSKEKQFFHCFGCGKNGDIFNFIQEIEGMEFAEALKYLANRAGVELQLRARSEVQQNQKNRLKEINQKAAYFYHNVLTKLDLAKDAKKYLLDRGVSDEAINTWNIGFVPEQWDLLTKYLLKKGFGIDDLVASGLTIKKDQANRQNGSGYYDRFRGRIMFPINNAFGDVVGFTGRVLVEHEKSGGKYVNSPQSPVYDKSRVLFGLDHAKRAIKEAGFAVIVEGQMDVVACHQAGMTNVVASSGTALTEEQVHLLARYAKELRMAFDSDAAGRKAAKRGIDIAIKEGLSVKVIQIPEGKGKDPDECIKADLGVWEMSVENAQDVMKWYFSNAFLNKDIKNPRVKQQVADELLDEIAKIPYAVERDHWIQELAGSLGIDGVVLREDLKRFTNKKKLKTNKFNNNQESSQPEPLKAVMKKNAEELVVDRFTESILSLMLMTAEGTQKLWEHLPHNLLSTLESTKKVYEHLKTLYSSGTLTSQLANPSDTDIYTKINVFILKGEKEFGSLTDVQKEKELLSLCDQLNKKYVDVRKKQLEREIELARNDKEKQDKLLDEFIKLTVN